MEDVMEPGDLLAIWLHDAAAKLLLGIHNVERPESRWVVVGSVIASSPSPIGVWISIQRFEERRPATESPDAKDAKRVLWTVNPSECLIRYEYIITAQRLKGAEPPDDPRPRPG
jgi:hypothetical protein